MPRDITREEANSDWTTTLVDAGEAAAFVSVLAAGLVAVGVLAFGPSCA